MSGTANYSVSGFMRDADAILATDAPLEDKKADIADRMSVLSRRDDLTRFALPIGHADGSTQNYLLAFEPPYTLLGLSQFDPHYYSPVHEHGDFWVIGCGWRGCDRWDMYERLDDGSLEGYADLKLVDQVLLPPGGTVWMPPPPRAIHSHNNETGGFNYELIFTSAKPMEPADRLFYDVEEKTCWPTLYAPSKIFPEHRWPPRLPGHDPDSHPKPTAEAASQCRDPSHPQTARLPRPGFLGRMRDGVNRLTRRISCPACDLMAVPARMRATR